LEFFSHSHAYFMTADAVNSMPERIALRSGERGVRVQCVKEITGHQINRQH